MYDSSSNHQKSDSKFKGIAEKNATKNTKH